MKVENKTIKVDQELTREIDFSDKAINDLYIKNGNRKDFKFSKHCYPSSHIKIMLF